MAEIVRNRNIPSTRNFKTPFKIDTKKVERDDTLIVNIKYEFLLYNKRFVFNGSQVAGKDSISFSVRKNGTDIEIIWNTIRPIVEQAIIFLRIAWMKNYQGVKQTDIPSGAGSFVTINQDGGEVCNFLPIQGYYYGYARIQSGRNLRLERIGAKLDNDYLSNVTVVFFAKNPSTGGEFIVGFYKNAIIYRNIKHLDETKRLGHPYYLVKARIKDCYLVNEDNRIFELPKENGPGQTNAWYPDVKYLAEVKKYISDPEKYVNRKPGKITSKGAWQKDVKLKKQIEEAAMDAVAAYFSQRGFDVTYVHMDNFGWDLEATKDKHRLLLEVKGLSGNNIQIEVTPNEYNKCKVNKKQFCFCVVTNALIQKKRKINVFFYKDNVWQDTEGTILKVNERTSARMYT